MKLSKDYVSAALEMQGIPVPEAEVENIRLRLELWMSALEEVESTIGSEMDNVDPIPPVYPRVGW